MAVWRLFKSKKEYRSALDRIEELIDAIRTDMNQNELMLISLLVEEYEEKFHPMPDAAPQDVIRFVMQMKGLKEQDVIPILGSKSNVSKILSGAAKLQLEMLDPLRSFLGIPVEALIPSTPPLDNKAKFSRQKSDSCATESKRDYSKKKASSK